MRFRISFMIMLLLIPQLVLASNVESLLAVIDDYTYAMTVEWDQKDKVFADSINKKFQTDISQLAEQGLTLEEIKVALPQTNFEEIEAEFNTLNVNDPIAMAHFIETHKNYKKFKN